MGPLGPKSEPAGDVNFKTFTKICMFGIFGVQYDIFLANPGRRGDVNFKNFTKNWDFGKSEPAGGRKFQKLHQKLAFLAFLGSKMVVLGSKMAVPSSVSSHGALPSAKTSPEIRLLGFPSSVSSHAALPSGKTFPAIRLLGEWADTSGVRVAVTARPPPARRLYVISTQGHCVSPKNRISGEFSAEGSAP